jgi:hypothetical protein
LTARGAVSAFLVWRNRDLFFIKITRSFSIFIAGIILVRSILSARLPPLPARTISIVSATVKLAAGLVKWNLRAEGAVLSKYGGGLPHADLAETARLLENMEIRTAVMVSDVSRDRPCGVGAFIQRPRSGRDRV